MKQSKFFFIVILISCGSMFSKSGFSQNQNSSWSVKQERSETFIENKGQFPAIKMDALNDAEILYALDDGPTKIYFSKTGTAYTFLKLAKKEETKENSSPEAWEEKEEAERQAEYETDIVSFTWENANSDVQIIGEEVSPDYFSYSFYDKNGTVKNENHIKGYRKIIYKNLYPNIDVEYTIHPEGGLKYALILHPGADVSMIKMKYSDASILSEDGDLHIPTLFGNMIDHAPKSYYTDETVYSIKSYFTKTKNTIGFVLDPYDNSKSVTIDPWVVSPNFSNSTAVWEVETDASGNVYVTGGEMPMQLKKYNSAGVLQWTYSTTWDTAQVWLGTLATDSLGNSFITSGTAPEMERIDSNGNMIWHNSGSAQSDEWWGITFNCDHTKLLVGGTILNMMAFKAFATIFEMDIDSGNVTTSMNIDTASLSGMGSNPIEVRSIASSNNGKCIFLTHNDVGAISQSFGSCSNGGALFQIDNGHNFSYKCENYLPATQNGGGLKALVVGDQFFYTHSGDSIHKRSISDGSLITSVLLPGGVNDTDTYGKIFVENCGLAVDECGNVYAGSSDRVVKFDADLNVLSQATVPFYVYDVSVNSNGEVIAVGAQSNNQSINRNGRIQSVNLSTCAQYSITECCDANICQEIDHICNFDPPFNFSAPTPGGIWSGAGITDSLAGTFNPMVAGTGTFTIYYSLPCGSDSININVYACANLILCQETNGDLTVTGGTGPYTWSAWDAVSPTPITNQTECEACGGTWTPFVNVCQIGGTPVTDCPGSAGWVSFGTGTTVTPPAGTDTIRVTDASMNSQTTYNASTLPNCNGCPAINVNPSNVTYVLCYGTSTGSFTATGAGGAAPYDYTLLNGSNVVATFSNVSGPQNFTGLLAGTYILNVVDNNGCPGSVTITITQPAAVSALITGAVPPSCGLSDGTISSSASGGVSPYTYSWDTSPVQTTATASGLPAGYYCVTITDNNGCSATACDSIVAAMFSAPEICIVTVDTATNQNIIIWEKPVTSGIDQYYIYREGSTGGIYNLVGSQNYSDLSAFTDISSNALIQPYRYKLSIFDICGFTSQLSNYHQTIHLVVSPGMGDAWNLQWNNYEGFSFTTYNIYRGSNPGNMILYYSVANTVNSFTDLTPPAGIVYYLVEAVRPDPCNSTIKLGTYSSSISNVAYGEPSGIFENSESEFIQVYPNPGEGIFTISFDVLTNEAATMEILNELGQIVYNGKMNAKTMEIDLSGLAKGMYTLKITAEEKRYYKKIMIE
jgi:hypothetical protein